VAAWLEPEVAEVVVDWQAWPADLAQACCSLASLVLQATAALS
jgi:hypothetical protein